MLARTSYILVIVRVSVGERKMAGVSQNSSGGGRVILGYMETQTAFRKPPLWHPEGCRQWVLAIKCSYLGLEFQQILLLDGPT